VSDRGGRERLREPPEAHRFSSVQGLHLVSSRACRAGAALLGLRRDGSPVIPRVAALLPPWPRAFRRCVERSCRALHSWAREWRWLRLALLWLADCTHQLRIGGRRGSSFSALAMSSAPWEFPNMRAAALLRRVSPPNHSGRARPSGDAGPRAVVALFRARRAGWSARARQPFQRAHRFLSKLLHPIGAEAISVACLEAIPSRSLSHRDLSAALHDT
jgi:hypothetical protein